MAFNGRLQPLERSSQPLGLAIGNRALWPCFCSRSPRVINNGFIALSAPDPGSLAGLIVIADEAVGRALSLELLIDSFDSAMTAAHCRDCGRVLVSEGSHQSHGARSGALLERTLVPGFSFRSI